MICLFQILEALKVTVMSMLWEKPVVYLSCMIPPSMVQLLSSQGCQVRIHEDGADPVQDLRDMNDVNALFITPQTLKVDKDLLDAAGIIHQYLLRSIIIYAP